MADNESQNPNESELSPEDNHDVAISGAEPTQPVSGVEPKVTEPPEDSSAENPDTHFSPQPERPLLAATTLSVGTVAAPTKDSKLMRLAVVVAVLVNVVMVGSSGYLFSVTKKSAANPDQASSKTNVALTQNQSTDKTTAKPEEPKIVHYSSEPLKLEFDYPSDWRIESDPSNKNIHLSSPLIKLNLADGSSAQAKVVIVIDEKYPGQLPYIVDNEARIVDNSQVITYSNPTTVQRKETNLSFSKVSSAKVLTDSGISSLFISGNYAYKKGELVSSKKYTGTNPFISVYASACLDSSCDLFSAAEITPDTYKNSPTFQQVKTLLASSRFN